MLNIPLLNRLSVQPLALASFVFINKGSVHSVSCRNYMSGDLGNVWLVIPKTLAHIDWFKVMVYDTVSAINKRYLCSLVCFFPYLTKEDTDLFLKQYV